MWLTRLLLRHVGHRTISSRRSSTGYFGEAGAALAASATTTRSAPARRQQVEQLRAVGHRARRPEYSDASRARSMADPMQPDDNAQGMACLALQDQVCDEAAKSRDRKGGRGGAAKSGGTGQRRDVQVSRALSRLLRHQADTAGINLDGEGFAPLDKVLAWGPLRSLNVTLADVQSVVATNEKQRFSLKLNPETARPDASTAADYLVRANQGHSIKLASSSMLEPVTLDNVPPRVLHGTYFVFWPAIEAAGGLKPMGRNHVHCSAGDASDSAEGELAVVSGMRRDAELVVEIDVEASLRQGVKWWRSDNGVVLTEGSEDGGLLSASFFKKVTGRKMNVGVLWEDGEKRADLPAGIKGRVPQGKGQGRSRGRGGGDRRRGGRGRGQDGRQDDE